MDARSDRRQAPRCLLPADARRRRHHPWLVALGRDRDSVPRNPGVGPARISGCTARQRARDQAGEMENHRPAGRDRLPPCGRSRRHGRPGGDADRTLAALDFCNPDHLYRLGLFPARHSSRPRGGWRMKVKYFAWVRERIGKAEETIEPPANVRTVDDLIAWLSTRDEGYAHAFEKPKVIRAAIDHAHVRPDAAISGAREIAFFPPMTGG